MNIFSKPLGDGKKRHIVFWYDENKDFVDDIDTLELDNVKLLKVNENNLFYTKYYVEKEDTESNILIYSNMKKPDPREDYLYDIYSYSEEFSTDRATVVMRELKITDSSLKEKFEEYNAFFRKKDRIAAFEKLNIEDYNADKIDIAVLAVLTKTKIMDLEEIIKTVIKDHLDGSSKIYEDIRKFGSEDEFWNILVKHYGYSFKEKSIERFMAMLLVTNIKETAYFNLPKKYAHFVSIKTNNCMVFINHFMNNLKDADYYDKMQTVIGKKLKINDLLLDKDSETFKDSYEFEVVDKIIISRVSDLIKDNVGEYDKYLNLISNRRRFHYYNKHEHEYKCLKWSINMLKKKEELISIIKSEDAASMMKSYVKDYYYFDKCYRKFYYHFDKIADNDVLADVKDIVENLYNNWYIAEIALKWNSALSDLKSWNINDILQQSKFYDEYIKFRSKERVFVIISDALRYESADELNTLLNNERKGSTDLSYMLGVLPSYTKLGMASLLPHSKIEIDDKYDVLVDGINSSSKNNRDKILKNTNINSMAVTFDEVMEMRDSEIRKAFAGQEVVYIYHNAIDAVGDHALTEKDVFDATETAFSEITTLVNKLVNRVSASKILITADHGYLYKRSPLSECNKLGSLKIDDSEDSRRFAITKDKEDIEGTMCFSMDYLLGDGSSKYVITPKGDARFKVQGAGCNYVHGGSMLQEVVIPVITFKNDRSLSSANKIKKVKITLTSITRKITNIITFLEFFQDEKIQDKVISQKIKCYFEDEDGNRISDIQTIMGDSRSENPKDRSYRVKFVLKSMTYDKTKQYFLVMQDEEDSDGDYERIPFNIDIAISDDFGF